MNNHLLLLLFGASVGVTGAGIIGLLTRRSCGIRPHPPPEAGQRPYSKPSGMAFVPVYKPTIRYSRYHGIPDDQIPQNELRATEDWRRTQEIFAGHNLGRKEKEKGAAE